MRCRKPILSNPIRNPRYHCLLGRADTSLKFDCHTGKSSRNRSLDKNIAFWTVYGKLAGEFDKEFQRKYGNDLDTSFIFAGLFSAVSSSFIIQIQPELQPDPNEATQALLMVLVQNMTGSVIPSLTPGQLGAPTMIVVAQTLLYFSLLSTLLAGLLAVLGKQCLLH
ncbi:hypothetical protein B0H17DRAFT_1135398 [Mycena rosella]|uniref:DUF6535 domain-containing protein n=1 Tax=Mycena rosella TaxID=1033263 RepID=A0AAD7DD99_MYCRO|nr:hypothetical protein B0H17DRAFT_1135398 [Mycena rosella]